LEATYLEKVYEDSEIVVKQGDVADCIYIILGGQVEVIYEKDGKEIQLTKLGLGNFIGEMAIIEPHTCSATVRAVGQVRVLTIDKKTFLRRMHEDPSMCLRILRQMSKRIRELGDELVRYAEISGNDLTNKVDIVAGNELIGDMIEEGQKTKEDIEKIISGMECAKGFKCNQSGFNNLCHAKDIGIDSFVECLETETKGCQFSFPFGMSHLCKCPLRVYIANEMNI